MTLIGERVQRLDDSLILWNAIDGDECMCTRWKWKWSVFGVIVTRGWSSDGLMKYADWLHKYLSRYKGV